MIKFDNHLGTAVWSLLNKFMLQKNPIAAGTSCVTIVRKSNEKGSNAITLCTEWVASGRNTGGVEWVGLP